MKKLKNLGNLIFWATLISPMVSFMLASIVGEAEIFGIAGIVKYSWIMWLFTPLAMLSIFVGVKLKKKEQKYKKNYIVALICLPLLIIWGSFKFIFNTFSYNADKITVIEREIKLDLPKQVKIATEKFDSYNVSYAKIIDSRAAEDFKNAIENDGLWKNELGFKLKSLLPIYIQYELDDFDYFVFYNVTLDEYNSYPNDGEYKIIFIAYDNEMQKLLILDDLIINLD